MRKMIALLCLFFLAAFAYTISSHMANEGRALLIGVAIGALSSVPAALVAAFLAARSSGARQTPRPARPATPRPAPQPPSVVIVNPGQPARHGRYAQYIDPMGEPPQQRTFTVVGEDEAP